MSYSTNATPTTAKFSPTANAIFQVSTLVVIFVIGITSLTIWL